MTLSAQKVEGIRAGRRAGRSIGQMARELGVSKSTVHRHCRQPAEACRHHWILADGASGVFEAVGRCRLCGTRRVHSGGLPPHGWGDDPDADIESGTHPWQLW